MFVTRRSEATAALIALALAGPAAMHSSGRQTNSALEQLAAFVERNPGAIESSLGGCLRMHHVWKAQVRAAAAPEEKRELLLIDTVFTPNREFWGGYLGDAAAFSKWVRTSKPIAADPRVDVPVRLRAGSLIVATAVRMEQLTGRRPCGDWFIVYGPGWTNLGGLGRNRMVLDIFGLPSRDPIGDVRFLLPHEMNHLLFDGPHRDGQRGTVLHRIIDEGFASFVADQYWGVGLSPAEALGYTDEQWAWAVEHEPLLWREARGHLSSTDRKTLDRFSSVSQSLVAGAPGKIGYFLGYRIVEDFVRRNGVDSWRQLYEMPLDRIVASTRFGEEVPTRR
jgi:hypothetical protein